ncbi:MAG: MFS transporter, partial [Bacteroidetes bacterium]|nr:MFS transporter [Bacteroidota bacterium]
MQNITRTIWLLSLVSLFTDMASEMLYPVMPVYLKSIGFSVLFIGVLEGLAEATAGLSKGYFGRLSDNSGKRVPFVQAGYGLSAIAKPMLALFVYPLWIFFSRTLDRLGKGIRTGARDAILSDEATSETKGKIFGFHRSLDTLGAVIGPLLAVLYLYFFPGHYKSLFLLA